MIDYEHRNIDDMVSQLIIGQGGFVLAVKNYDGEIFSEIVASGFGVHGLMFNRLVGQNGEVMVETNHGTIPRHYYQYKQGQEAISNPIATIYAWTEGLRHRARLDDNKKLFKYCDCMRDAVQDVVNKKKIMTRDLAISIHRDTPVQIGKDYVGMKDFLKEVQKSFLEEWKP